MSEGGLREVREEELQGLSSRLARFLPYSFTVHGVVGLAARCGLQSVKPASIFIPARSRPSSFTLIANIMASTEHFRSVSVFWDLEKEEKEEEEEEEEDVAGLLASLPDWDWTQPVILYSCPETVIRAFEKLSIPGCQQLRVDTSLIAHLYTFEAPELPLPQLPDGYYLTNLRKEDVGTVWTHWLYNRICTRAAFKDFVTTFPSIGVRRCDVTDMGDSNLPHVGSRADHGSLRNETGGTLVSWVHLQRDICMGNTYTLPQHRRRGLAKAATAALTRRLLHEGQLPSVKIAPTNNASIKLHESLGFQKRCLMNNAFLLPTESTMQQVLPLTYK